MADEWRSSDVGRPAPKSPTWWLLQGPGWLLLAYLAYAQALPVFDYEWGMRMGTQESAAQATEVGVACWWAAWGLWQLCLEGRGTSRPAVSAHLPR